MIKMLSMEMDVILFAKFKLFINVLEHQANAILYAQMVGLMLEKLVMTLILLQEMVAIHCAKLNRYTNVLEPQANVI